MAGYAAINEAFKLAKTKNDILRQALKQNQGARAGSVLQASSRKASGEGSEAKARSGAASKK